MTPKRKREMLAAIYRRIPALECKRLCASECGFDIPVRRVEIVQLRKRLPMIDQHVHPTPAGMRGAEPLLWLRDARGGCPAYDGRGSCTVHDARPFICRVWGTVDTLRCPHGCVPERLLTDAEARELGRAVDELDRE